MKTMSLVYAFLLFCSVHGWCDRIIADGVISTSFVRLLAHPEKYSGKRVEIIGFYKSELEENALYLSRDDADHFNLEHSFWISLGPKDHTNASRAKNKYVRIQGDFHYEAGKGQGHLGMWVANFRNVSFFEAKKR